TAETMNILNARFIVKLRLVSIVVWPARKRHARSLRRELNHRTDSRVRRNCSDFRRSSCCCRLRGWKYGLTERRFAWRTRWHCGSNRRANGFGGHWRSRLRSYKLRQPRCALSLFVFAVQQLVIEFGFRHCYPPPGAAAPPEIPFIIDAKSCAPLCPAARAFSVPGPSPSRFVCAPTCVPYKLFNKFNPCWRCVSFSCAL